MHPAARTLLEYMSSLSEQAWAASWMDGLEYDLWEAMQSGPRRYGRTLLHDGALATLRELSEACGGWIHVDGERGEVFVPREEWLRTYEARNRSS